MIFIQIEWLRVILLTSELDKGIGKCLRIICKAEDFQDW